MAPRKSTAQVEPVYQQEDDDVTDIRSAIAKRLCEIIQAAPKLFKDERNEFAKYNYVSIDTYYENFASLAAKHGLTWVAREVSFETIEASDDRGGRSRTLAKMTYTFDVYLSGVGYVEDFTRFTLLHPITGAQTTGSAVSYAEKVFIRTAMKAVTGEPDADASEPRAVNSVRPVQAAPNRPPSGPMTEVINRAKDHVDGMEDVEGQRLPVLKEAADSAVAVEVFRVFAPLCKTEDQLRAFWSQNKPAHSAIRQADPDAYATITAIFNDRMKEIKNG